MLIEWHSNEVDGCIKGLPATPHFTPCGDHTHLRRLSFVVTENTHKASPETESKTG